MPSVVKTVARYNDCREISFGIRRAYAIAVRFCPPQRKYAARCSALLILTPFRGTQARMRRNEMKITTVIRAMDPRRQAKVLHNGLSTPMLLVTIVMLG